MSISIVIFIAPPCDVPMYASVVTPRFLGTDSFRIAGQIFDALENDIPKLRIALR